MTDLPLGPKPLVTCRGLTKQFGTARRSLFGRGPVPAPAVDRVDLDVARSETLALVGESGCGKSTTGRLIMRMIEPSSGTVRFDGTDLGTLSKRELRTTKRRLQLMFQDSFGAFNPRMTVASIIAEPLLLAGIASEERNERVKELLPMVGLQPDHAARFPHQFSGGQRQRIGIARALALRPDFIVCDEPVSALDVSVQAQVVNLLTDLQQKHGLTYLFISHDLRVVRHIADRVAVMYLGRVVELADKADLYARPEHPYTQLLLAAVPQIKTGFDRTPFVAAAEPGPPSDGCMFAPRCRHAMPVCRTVEPALLPTGSGHASACHLVHPAA